MKKFLIALIVLSQLAFIAPAHVSGQIDAPSCLGYAPLNLNGQTLEVWMSGVMVASAPIGGRVFLTEDGTPVLGGHNYFDVFIPSEGFAQFVVNGRVWGGRVIHPGDNLTFNLCGDMPLVKVKKGHK
jgi:hypothetical protein